MKVKWRDFFRYFLGLIVILTLIGLVLFVLFRDKFETKDQPPQPAVLSELDIKKNQLLESIAKSKDPGLILTLNDLLLTEREVKNRYVDEKSSAEILNLAMKGMVEGLDPNSNLFIGKEVSLIIGDLRGEKSYFGVGMSVTSFYKEIVVMEVFENSPAFEAGIKPGDFITAVDGKNIFGISVEEVVGMIKKGKEGTEVSVEIKSVRLQKPKKFSLARRKINVLSVVRKDLGDNTGYIKIKTFSEETPALFAKALDDLSANRKLIIDLRNNLGGQLDSVVKMLSYLLGPDVTVITERRREKEVSSVSTILPLENFQVMVKNLAKPKKIVVLINNFSASASEIMAGNMQYYKKADLIGVRTFGKATVQHYIDLENPDQLPNKNTRLLMGITVARYYLPNGRNISSSGVEPDVEIEQPEGFRTYEYGTTRDAQLQAAIKFLKNK